jgi:hypothetical protein
MSKEPEKKLLDIPSDKVELKADGEFKALTQQQ